MTPFGTLGSLTYQIKGHCLITQTLQLKESGSKKMLLRCCIMKFMGEKIKFKILKKIVGLLQREIRIKSDLVYNKHSGELVG